MLKITFDGKTQSAAQWAREIGIQDKALRWRLKAGWKIEDCLRGLIPSSQRKHHRSTSVQVGMRFNRWVVLEDLGTAKPHYARLWRCRCDCGTVGQIRHGLLVRGGSQSCGCFGAEQRNKANTTHGKSRSIEHRTWQRIIQRCHNPKERSYYRYGGRGITVCDRWRESFDAFLADMGERPKDKQTVERKDNSKGYSPDNCCWATYAEQNRNRRGNHWITVNGETLVLQDWADRLGTKPQTIIGRLDSGMSEQEAVTRPIKRIPPTLFEQQQKGQKAREETQLPDL